MKNIIRKILSRVGLTAGTLGLVIAGAAAFSAFEAHIVNVTATIENATNISTSALGFGTVFPEEVLHSPVTLSLSSSFLSQGNTGATNVDYVIKQKPKCQLNLGVDPALQLPQYAQVTENAQGVFSCPDPVHYHIMPLLCPYLSKTSPREGDTSIPSFHGPTASASWTDQISTKYEAIGHLSKNGIASTSWDIDLHTPCFTGQCSQDWAKYVHAANPTASASAYFADPSLQGKQMGCDLWYELYNVSTTPVPSPTPIPTL
jgi:hypothetical protein